MRPLLNKLLLATMFTLLLVACGAEPEPAPDPPPADPDAVVATPAPTEEQSYPAVATSVPSDAAADEDGAASAEFQPAPPVRITFGPGETSATRNGLLEAGGTDRYALRALEGQTMRVGVASPAGSVLANVSDATGQPVPRTGATLSGWEGVLPATGDYIISVASAGDATDYTLAVEVEPLPDDNAPVRVTFAPGQTALQLNGFLETNATNRYVLRAIQGQSMEVFLAFPDVGVALGVRGEDGTTYLDPSAGSRAWYRLSLPATQDYFIDVVSFGDPTGYTLAISTSPLARLPREVRFAPGATSASFAGGLQPGEFDRYALDLLAGQTFRIVSSSNEPVDIWLESADGTFWDVAYGSGETNSLVATVPSTQTYIVTISAPFAAQQVTYSVTFAADPVSGAPPPTPVPPTPLQFAPGAVSTAVSGSLPGPNMTDRYSIDAAGGQIMQTVLSSVQGDAWVAVESAAGAPISPVGAIGMERWIGLLPATQTYIAGVTNAVTAAGGQSDYTLSVVIKPPGVQERIEFEPGSVAATVGGALGTIDYDAYVVGAAAGQRMRVNASSGASGVFVRVQGADGSVFGSYVDLFETGWEGVLPSTQDYYVFVGSSGASGEYTATVIIE